MSVVARVTGQGRHYYAVLSEQGELKAKLSGSLRYNSVFKSDLPAVGDWVEISLRGDKAYIVSVQKRKSCFSRRSSGNVVDEQVLAANLDILFIVMALDENYNLKRLQRYISAAGSGNIQPVVLLSKSDLCDNVSSMTDMVKKMIPKVEVFTVNSKDPSVLRIFEIFLKPGVTAAFTGSSGVGKSTLINMLIGEERQKTADISQSVKKGRHTTSSRDMIFLDSGAIVIDTPGIREIQMWETEDPAGFERIAEIAAGCRFADCEHDTEPDCAVKEAILKGQLDENILEMWKIQCLETMELRQKKEISEKILEHRKSKKRRST